MKSIACQVKLFASLSLSDVSFVSFVVSSSVNKAIKASAKATTAETAMTITRIGHTISVNFSSNWVRGKEIIKYGTTPTTTQAVNNTKDNFKIICKFSILLFFVSKLIEMNKDTFHNTGNESNQSIMDRIKETRAGYMERRKVLMLGFNGGGGGGGDSGVVPICPKGLPLLNLDGSVKRNKRSLFS